MTRLSLAKDPKTALKGADCLLFLAPKKLLTKKAIPKLLTGKAQEALVELGKATKPGDLGGTKTSLSGGTPTWVAVGALPDELSRYNSPTRSEAIAKVVGQAGLGDHTKSAVVILLEDPNHDAAAANAVGRALPQFSMRTGSKSNPQVQIALIDDKGGAIAPTAFAKEVLRCARDSAELVDTPPTDLNPGAFAERAKAMLGAIGVKAQVIAGDQLLKRRLGGIHAVGRAAVVPPRMLIAKYSPRRATKNTKHIALVGKGVTFDTGGLHLKPRGAIETMKCDMGGAAAVLGAFRVLVKTKASHKITLIMCMAENAIDGRSYKPDDVLTMHSGKTVEINNTDAEGRLLLADGVSYAARELKATHVFDAATLTGAQMVATGAAHAAVVSNDQALEDLFVETGRNVGDLVHPLPFAPEFYKQEFSSNIADMKNSVKNRMNAQSSCAAQFIYNHLEGTKVRWVHVDLAGPAFRNDRGTGFGVALLSAAVRSL